jgi:Rieske Fe-S protein
MRAEPSEPEAGQPTRRQFLGYLTEILFALLALGAAVPLVGSAIAPALQKRRERWVDVGPASDVKPGTPLRVDISYQSSDGWLLKRVRDAAYIVTKDGGSFFVLSNVCTHLKCRVRWEEARQGFFCPCHDGLFDVDGKVVKGPPPRPLDRLRHKVEKGRVLIEVRQA